MPSFLKRINIMAISSFCVYGTCVTCVKALSSENLCQLASPSDRVFEALVGCQLKIPLLLGDQSSKMGYVNGNGKQVSAQP
jgi:hypothetical protein